METKEEHLAFRLTQAVTQKMNTTIDWNFTKLHATLEGLIKRITGNTKHMTEAGYWDVENHTVCLIRLPSLNKKWKLCHNKSRTENIRICGLKEGWRDNRSIPWIVAPQQFGSARRMTVN